MSNVFTDTFAWLGDPLHWAGSTGIPVRLAEHLQYTGLVMLIATAIAVPIGLYVGHTGRGRVAVVALAGALRALPTPLLAGTYAGIASVDRNVVDAARAMGMTELQVLFRAEVPNALTVMFGGFRTGVLQVIATVSVVAYINLGGLGRYLFDGLVLSDFPQMLGGSLLIAGLAIAVDVILAVFQRLFLSRRVSATPDRSQQAPVDLTDPVSAEPVLQGGTS
jgi:osmoprotectant transport system permease protein